MAKIDVNEPEAVVAFGMVPVTLCPVGQRSREVVERARAGTVPVSTQTALQWPQARSSVPSARNDPRPAHERVEAARRAEALSVALAQPHRNGSDDPRLAFPLWRFCLRAWPNDADFREVMYKTGASYETEVRLVRVARGFHVIGGKDEDSAHGEVEIEDPTPEEIAAQRAAREGLERTLERSNDVIRSLHPTRGPRALESLCFDHNEPSPYDEGLLMGCLSLLAFHYGHRERPRHRT